MIEPRAGVLVLSALPEPWPAAVVDHLDRKLVWWSVCAAERDAVLRQARGVFQREFLEGRTAIHGPVWDAWIVHRLRSIHALLYRVEGRTTVRAFEVPAPCQRRVAVLVGAAVWQPWGDVA